MKVNICFNLKTEENPAEFEKWVKEQFDKIMPAFKGAKGCEVLRVANTLQGTYPFQYMVQIELENEMGLMMLPFTAGVPELMKQFPTKVENYTIFTAKNI
jgi:hypothetical protein